MKQTRQKKWLTILIHAAAWVLLFSLPYLLRPSYDASEHKHGPQETDATISFLMARVTDLMLIGFFYLNAGMLVTRLLYKKKYLLYLLGILICFAAFSG